jgi:hypothetical protein
MTRAVAALLSILGPAVVFGGFYQTLISWEDADDANATRNAGRILNSRVIDQGVVTAMEAMLERRQPEVLIIGPSYANTDVKPELIAARLGVPRDKVLLLSVPNSVGSHWYAVLKNRVYANGHAPKLVVVVSGLQSMLLNTPLTESSFVNLGVHLTDEPDPEIQKRVKRTADMQVAHLREQRGKLRESVFDALRFRPATALVSSPSGQRVTVAEVRGALARVFDDDNVDMKLHSASMPFVEADRLDDRAYTPAMLPPPEESFIPVITDLVEAHGGRTVWVRPPMSPHIPDHLDDVVLPGVQEATQQLLAPMAGDLVDMRGLPMTAAMFKNEDHMNEEGSRRFSEALAKSLQDLDAMAPKPRPELAEPVTVTGVAVALDGSESAVAVAPEGLALNGLSAVRWSIPAWDRMRGPFGVQLVLEAPEGLPAPTVALGARDLSLSRVEVVDGVARWEVDVRMPAPEAPIELRVSLPPSEDDGAVESHRVRAAAFGVGRGRVFLAGTASALDGHRAELFGVHEVAGGVFEDHTVRPDFTRKPVKVPGHDRDVTDLPNSVIAAFETERWAFLSDEALIGETNFGSRCSPLRITENGTLLPEANVPCTEVQRRKDGRSCHTTQRIFFTASDRTDPATNGRIYRLVLDEGRLCDGAVFLYPKDAFEVRFPADRLQGFSDGARYFTLGANYLNHRQATVKVTLTVDGKPVVAETVNGPDLEKGPRTWLLPEPVRDGADVVLSMENEASVFYLVTEATLSERAP